MKSEQAVLPNPCLEEEEEEEDYLVRITCYEASNYVTFSSPFLLSLSSFHYSFASIQTTGRTVVLYIVFSNVYTGDGTRQTLLPTKIELNVF
jgi:hypothetical protein